MRESVHFHLYAIVRVCRKLRRISRLCCHQLRRQACASAYIPSVIGFSACSQSVVGLRLPFLLFVIGCSRVCLQQLKMVYSDYVKQRILFYRQLGFIQITRCLAEERHATTNIGVCKPIHRYKKTGMISHTPGSGKASKFTADAKKIIEEQRKRTTTRQM